MLRGIALRTPLVPFGRPDRRQWLKAESLQPIGAFKLRGAYVAAASLDPPRACPRAHHLLQRQPRAGGRARGPPPGRAGGDRDAVRRARRSSGPGWRPTAPRSSIVGTASDERRRVAEELAASRGFAIIPPFDDARIVAGQGTVGLEIVEDLPEVAAVLVPIGGGGLASGVAAAVKGLSPATRVIGVEPELAADARDSLAAGHVVAWPAEQVSRTIADGTRTQSIGPAATSSTCPGCSTAWSRCPRPRSPPRSAWPPRRRGSSSSRRGRCRSRRCGSMRGRPGSSASTGRSWAWSRAGTSTPDRYVAYLESPIPHEG